MPSQHVSCIVHGRCVLVFTAGVGENSAFIREAACEGFAYLGLHLDKKKNGDKSLGERDIAQTDSRVRVLVIPASEDWAVARECWQLTEANR